MFLKVQTFSSNRMETRDWWWHERHNLQQEQDLGRRVFHQHFSCLWHKGQRWAENSLFLVCSIHQAIALSAGRGRAMTPCSALRALVSTHVGCSLMWEWGWWSRCWLFLYPFLVPMVHVLPVSWMTSLRLISWLMSCNYGLKLLTCH